MNSNVEGRGFVKSKNQPQKDFSSVFTLLLIYRQSTSNCNCGHDFEYNDT